MSTLLSIHDGHNASAALLVDGKILSCVSEERLNRKKFYWGFPTQAIEYVFSSRKINPKTVDVICVSHLSTIRYAMRRLVDGSTYNIFRPKIILGNFYNIYQAAQRERAIRKFRNKYCPNATLYFSDHHRAHAASAYYCSGVQDALVVTCDNLGDTLSHTAWSVKNGSWTHLVQGDGNESLGAFYGAVTEALGFKPNQHEGKIVGLAAYADGSKLLSEMRTHCVHATKDKMHFSRNRYKAMVSWIREKINEGYTKEEVSSAAQTLLEEVMVGHIQALLKHHPHTSVVLAGGVFANVKLNQRIKDACEINHIFIQPAMGDEGLVLGSAWRCLAEKRKEPIHDSPLATVYFGTQFSTDEVQQRIGNKYNVEPVSSIASLAQRIADGVILGIFDGAMEFGPRALGARSIVADPRNKEVNNVLNTRLKRSDFMPFAPSVLIEYGEKLFKNIAPAKHAAEFMTITFDVTKEWAEKVPAIVHVDATARPQFVRKDRNKNYWELIQAFNEITGIPLVMNTSFNMHEEPIVSSPEDALRSLDVGAVDAVVFNYEFLVTRKAENKK
jgi:carbamoyltransferase